MQAFPDSKEDTSTGDAFAGAEEIAKACGHKVEALNLNMFGAHFRLQTFETEAPTCEGGYNPVVLYR